MSPRNSEPTTEERAESLAVDDAEAEDLPPWPERGPEVVEARDARKAGEAREADDLDDIDAADELDRADDDLDPVDDDTTVPPPEPEPIPMPGPDPQPEPIPQPGPDPAPPPGPDPRPGPVPQPPGPDPVPQPGPDPAPEPGPVATVGTLELALHEQSEADVRTLDDDVDIEFAPERDLGPEPERELRPPLEPPPGVEELARPLLPDPGVWEERWTAVQASFVDDPGESIQQADRLVTEAMEDLAKMLLSRREALHQQWRTDATPDTEQLRVAVQGYRALLFGLLSA